MDIVVFGAGSLGSLVGGLLARSHEVTLVGRSEHVCAIERDGLELTGQITDRTFPRATTETDALAGDLVVVTVKSPDTETAARTLASGSFDVALSVQNGMGNESILAEYLPCPVLAGTTTFGARLASEGVVECTGRGEVTLGPVSGGSSPEADQVHEAFGESDIETTLSTDMPRVRWEKLAVNAGINAVTALTRGENGIVLEAPTTDISRAATRETARTARAHDVGLSNREALESLESVARNTAENTSSMLQDVRAGRRTEIDAINGYILDRARECGLEVPANRFLTTLVRTWEHGQGLR